jgi:hypothetical protein
MSGLFVCAASDPIYRVGVDLVAVGFCEDERPLRGAAGLVDWRLCGALSRLIRARRTRGARGDAVLMPADGGLLAERVLALGLGPVAQCDQAAGLDAVVEALARAAALRVRSLALPAPFVAEPGEDERGLDALLAAALSGWQARVGAADALLVLVGQPDRGPALVRALRARARGVPEGLQILLPEEPPREPPGGLRRLPAGA